MAELAPRGRVLEVRTDETAEMFAPHPNLSDDVNRKIVQSEVEGGVFLSSLRPRTVLHIQTCHHCYTAVLLRDNLVLLWGHPEICPRPVTVAISGSTWGGTMLERPVSWGAECGSSSITLPIELLL